MNEFSTMNGYLCIITAGSLVAKLGGSVLTEASKLVGNTEIAGNYIKIELWFITRISCTLICEQSGVMNVGGTVLKEQGDLDSDASKEQRLAMVGGSALGATSSMVDNKYASAALNTGGERDVTADLSPGVVV